MAASSADTQPQMPHVTYGKSSGSGIHDRIIDILGQLTDIQWGFVRSQGHVQYITSAEIPITIIVIYPNFYKRLGNFRVDIAIAIPQSDSDFILTHDLATKLLRKRGIPKDVRLAIKNWCQVAEPTYLRMMADLGDADEDDTPSRVSHRSQGRTVDAWLNECRI